MLTGWRTGLWRGETDREADGGHGAAAADSGGEGRNARDATGVGGWGGGLRDAGRAAPLHTVLHCQCGWVNGAERGCCTGMRTGLLRRPDWECWVGN